MNRRVLTTLLLIVLIAVHTAGLTEALHLATAHADPCGLSGCHPSGEHNQAPDDKLLLSAHPDASDRGHCPPAECSTCRTLAGLHADRAVVPVVLGLDLPAGGCLPVFPVSDFSRSDELSLVSAPRGPPVFEA